eukprot:TRINITY_DN10745_c1_g1_i2.p1 TRINITY_DN10745_c1_g1~~TRINITY_DN10745_c1_g1_i2.p1  ORF type:complete len:780 (+),score=342.50 TRINITY_DN10745_c1_g1_i2:161-2500(+)
MAELKGKVRADFEAETEEEISLSAGTIVTITQQEDDGWWTVLTDDGRSGIFPESYIEIIKEETPPLPPKITRPRSIAAPSVRSKEPLINTTFALSNSNDSVIPVPIPAEPTNAAPPPPPPAAPSPLPPRGRAAPVSRVGAPGSGPRPLSSPSGAPISRGGPRGGGSPVGARPLPTPGAPGPVAGSPGGSPGSTRGAPRGGAGSVRGRPLPAAGSAPALSSLSSSPSRSSELSDSDGLDKASLDEEDTDNTDSAETSSPPAESAIDVEPTVAATPAPAPASTESQSDLDKKMWHRTQVLKEILTTEIDYVRDLETVVNVFLKPIREKKILPEADITSMFSDIELIVTVNRAVCLEFERANEKQLADPDKPLLLGDIFLRLSDCFKMYTNYCTNQPIAMGVLDRCQKKYPVFDKLLKDCMEDGSCRGLSLLSFLIKPVQRICKYPLLLRDLIKDTPEDHPDYNALNLAFEKIEKVVEYVNERKRQAETLQKTFQIQDQIEGGDKLNLVEPSRRFVRDGLFNIYVRNVKKEWKIYLFTDLVVITKPKKNIIGQDARDHYKSTVSLGNARLVDLADSDEISNAFEFTNKSGSPPFSYVIQFATLDEKKDWSREVKTLIRLFQEREAREKKAELKKKASSDGIESEEPEASGSSPIPIKGRPGLRDSSSAVSSPSLLSSSPSSSSSSSLAASPGVPTIGRMAPGIAGRPPPPAGFGRGRPPPPVLGGGSPGKPAKKEKEKDKKKEKEKDKKKPLASSGSLPRIAKQPKDFQKELSKALSAKPSS